MSTAAKNLACIAERFPAIAKHIRNSLAAEPELEQATTQTATHKQGERSPYRWERARNGGITMQYQNADGKSIWLYSSINPQREAARAAERIESAYSPSIANSAIESAAKQKDIAQPPMLIVISPLGNGYLAEELLARFRISDIAIVISDARLCACALESRDLRPLLQNPRLSLHLLPSPQQAAMLTSKIYLPALHKKAALLWSEPLAIHIPAQRSARAEMQNALHDALGALAIYDRMGKVWTRNILINSALMHTRNEAPTIATKEKERRREQESTVRQSSKTPHLSPIARERQRAALVVAAGPSLDCQIAKIQQRVQRGKQGPALISTDSALPVLRQHNITADACVTLDCQLASYLHFLGAEAAETPLYADFAAHPSLCRMQKNRITTESAHPLSRILSPALQLESPLSRAQHVTQSAFALAIARYAPEQITVYGADYCYTVGQAYARGAYIPVHHLIHSDLTRPLELQSLRFSWQYNNRPSTEADRKRITPRFFRDYRAQLLDYAYTQGYEMIAENAEEGMRFQRSNSEEERIRPHAHTTHSDQVDDAATASNTDILEVLAQYRQNINSISTPTPPYHQYLNRLSHNEMLALFSLLPLMVHIERRPWRVSHANAFEAARAEIRKRIHHCEKLIERGTDGLSQDTAAE